MIAALLYKEYREHRSIWLALAAVAAAVLVGVPYVFRSEMHPQSLLPDMLRPTAIVLAWTYGLVCGAMLLAGETEGGTQVFLDTMPSSRLALWRGKFLVGGLFVLLHLAFLVVLVGVQGIALPEQGLAATAGALVYAGLAGFAWGLLCSAQTKNVLGAIGLAILVQLTLVPLVSFPLLMLAVLLAKHLDMPAPMEVAMFLLAAVLMLAPLLALSALLYSRVDRERHPWHSAGRLVRGWIGEAEVFLLVRRQMRGFLGGLFLFCLVAGVLVLSNGLVAWPIVTLAVGVFCGVAVFLDEQGGAYRFLGDQRFPLGRIWTVKVVMWLGVLFLAVGVVFLPSLVRAGALASEPNKRFLGSFFLHLFGMGILKEAVPLGLFLFLFPIYGFVVGCVCGILFRKPLVALVTGLGFAALLVSVWIPSFLTGGLHGWQTIGPVVVLLVCARLLMRPWASDRLRSWETVRCVAVAVLLSAALTALGLWYRVAEVPNVPEPEDFAAFVESLPTPEENQAGALIRSACSRLEDLTRQWKRDHPRKERRPGGPQVEEPTLTDQVDDLLQHGWPENPPKLTAFVDAAFAADWWKKLAEASRKPVGVVEDPRTLTVASELRTLDSARLAGTLLAARGLQMQKIKGDPTVFVHHFAIALALARNMRHDSPELPAGVARFIEGAQLRALPHWLKNLTGRPDLLRLATHLLVQYEASLPPDSRQQELAEYIIGRNTVAQLSSWILGASRGSERHVDPYQIALLEAVWQIPWEKARQQRLMRAAYWGGPSERSERFSQLTPWVSDFCACPKVARSEDVPSLRQVGLRAAELMLALRWFQAETGSPAERLDQLTPKYLPRIPEDPFDGKPFRYRLSKGEEIDWPEDNDRPARAAGPVAPLGVPGRVPGPAAAPAPAKRKVPVGQGILWSVGWNRLDNGGKRQGFPWKQPGTDFIFLVPLPAAKGR